MLLHAGGCLYAATIVTLEAACLLLHMGVACFACSSNCHTGGCLFAAMHWGLLVCFNTLEAACLLLDTGGCLFDVSHRILLVCCNTKEAA